MSTNTCEFKNCGEYVCHRITICTILSKLALVLTLIAVVSGRSLANGGASVSSVSSAETDIPPSALDGKRLFFKAEERRVMASGPVPVVPDSSTLSDEIHTPDVPKAAFSITRNSPSTERRQMTSVRYLARV